MTQSSTDASSIYTDCWYTYVGTDIAIDDMLSSAWWLDPPTMSPIHVQKPMPQVIAPNIETRSCKRFIGHKFRLGGSKK